MYIFKHFEQSRVLTFVRIQSNITD